MIHQLTADQSSELHNSHLAIARSTVPAPVAPNQVVSVVPTDAESAGEDRLRSGNTGITGGHAHAAVRMHAFPVIGQFWAYCPKSETRHFQRWKVAA